MVGSSTMLLEYIKPKEENDKKEEENKLENKNEENNKKENCETK